MERDQQIAVFNWAKLKYKGVNKEWLELMYATGNGIHSNGKHIEIAKYSGLKVGLPDIVLPVPNGKYGALYIEMKDFGKKATKEQLYFIELLNKYGNYACVCVGAGEAQVVIEKYLKGEL